MIIKKFTTDDNGEYRCRCWKNGGKMNYSPIIEIKISPEDTTVNLKCPLSGSHHQWERKERMGFRALDIHDQSLKGVNHYWLQIFKVNVAYTGVYRCKVNWQATGNIIMLIIQDSIDGNWSEWSSYSTCQVSCGNGYKTRTRTCTDPAPSGYGKNCIGRSIDNEECSLNACPEWSSWTESSECSTGCGYGQITKTRVCRYQNKRVKDNLCEASSQKTEECFISPCEVISGGNQKISCNYQHYVRWGRLRTSDQNFIPLESNNPKYEGLNQREITIKNIDYFDNGTYKCSQHDNYWQYGKQIEIIVKGKPQISVPQQTYSIFIGGTITLRCSSDGTNPPLKKLWWTSNNGKEASELQGKYQNGNTNNHDLTILRITAEDEGTYTCHGQNSMGVSSSTTKIIIGYKPSIKIEESYIARKNENVTLQCEVVKGDHVQISWIRVENNRLTTSKRLSSTTTLTIPNVQKTDGGNYTCKARNDFGEHEATTTMKVLDASINKTSYEGDANKSLKLDCTINDAKDVRWFLNGSLINTENHRKYHGGNIKEASLTIYNLSRDDRGSYVCQAVYDFVEDNSQPIELSVSDVPYMQQVLEMVLIERGGIAILPCDFHSVPKPTEVKWTKDGKDIELDFIKYNGSNLDTSDLIIYNTDSSDSGKYICFVTNRLGKAEGKPIQLSIEEKRRNQEHSYPLIIAGPTVGLILIIVGVVFVVRRRRLFSNSHVYESNVVQSVEVHAYSFTSQTHQIRSQDSDKSISYQVVTKEDTNLSEPLHSKLYTIQDLLLLFRDKEKCNEQILMEFQALKQAREDTNEYNNILCEDAIIVKDYTNTANIKVTVHGDNSSIIGIIPSKRDTESFWKFIHDYHIGNIIVMETGGDMTSTFVPSIEQNLKMKNFMVEVTSLEKNAHGILLCKIQLSNQKTRTNTKVSLYKTQNWDTNESSPSKESLIELLNVTSSASKTVALLGSSQHGMRICGVLKVCLDGIFALDRQLGINIYQSSKKMIGSTFFTELGDYELCYDLIQHYLENEHVYTYVE